MRVCSVSEETTMASFLDGDSSATEIVSSPCPSESSPLLGNKQDTCLFSQRTVPTVATSGSDEYSLKSYIEHDPRQDLEAGQQPVLGCVVTFQTRTTTTMAAPAATSPHREANISRQQHCGEDRQDDGNKAEEGPLPDTTDRINVVEGVIEVAEALIEELYDVDEGETQHFLEMTLTRNLSILPGDVADAAVQAPPPPPPPPPSLSEKSDPCLEDTTALVAKEMDDNNKDNNHIPMSAYLLLLGAIVSLSAIGPLLQIQNGASPTLKIVWRMAGTSIVLLPLAIVDVYKTTGASLPNFSCFRQMTAFLLSTFFYNVFAVAFVIALDYTAVGNAVILSNSLSLILLVGKIFAGDPISFLEGGGAGVAFAGAALCSKDSSESGDGIVDDATSTATAVNSGIYGDFLAVLSALGGVGYLVFAKLSRRHMSLFVFMFLTMSIGCIMILAFQMLVLQEHVTFDRHPDHGLWGFLIIDRTDRLLLELVMVLVCNFIGTMGYVQAMQYFDNIVISSATLMEPVVAEFLAFGFGVGTLPGWQGWLGNALVVLGTLAVVYQDDENNKTNHNYKNKL